MVAFQRIVRDGEPQALGIHGFRIGIWDGPLAMPLDAQAVRRTADRRVRSALGGYVARVRRQELSEGLVPPWPGMHGRCQADWSVVGRAGVDEWLRGEVDLLAARCFRCRQIMLGVFCDGDGELGVDRLTELLESDEHHVIADLANGGIVSIDGDVAPVCSWRWRGKGVGCLDLASFGIRRSAA